VGQPQRGEVLDEKALRSHRDILLSFNNSSKPFSERSTLNKN